MEEEYIFVRVVKVSKSHRCEACGGRIMKGERAFVEVQKYRLGRYPLCLYYHYSGGVNPKLIVIMTPNEIRKKICSKRGI